MKPLVILAFAGCLLLNTHAFAEEDTVPIEQPVATFNRPEGWPGYPDDNGVLTVSADGKASIDMILVKAADASAAEGFALALFAKRRVSISRASRHEMPARRIGERSACVIGFDVHLPEGPARVLLMLVKLDRPGSYLMISEQGAPGALNANATEIERLLNSVKLTK